MPTVKVDLHNKYAPGQKLYLEVEVQEVYIDDTGVCYGVEIQGLGNSGEFLSNVPEEALLEHVTPRDAKKAYVHYCD